MEELIVPSASEGQKSQEEASVGANPPTGDIDNDDYYKKELERTQRELGQAQHVIQKLKEKKDDDPNEVPIIDESVIEAAVERKIAPIIRTLQETQAQQLVRERTASSAEAELALFHLKNTIMPSGNLATDVENAIALANRGRIQKTVSELKRSVVSQSNRTPVSGGDQRLPQKETVTLSPDEERIAKAYGLTPEELKKNQ